MSSVEEVNDESLEIEDEVNFESSPLYLDMILKLNDLENENENLKNELERINTDMMGLQENYQSEIVVAESLDEINKNIKDTRDFGLVVIWFIFVLISFYIARWFYKKIILNWINRLLKFRI